MHITNSTVCFTQSCVKAMMKTLTTLFAVSRPMANDNFTQATAYLKQAVPLMIQVSNPDNAD